MSQQECDLLCLDLRVGERIRKALPDQDQLELSSDLAKGLADPTRLEIATALSLADELCGCDLAWICSRQQNLVSHHLRVLRDAGLIDSRRDGKMVMHSLTDQGRLVLRSVLDTKGVTV